MTPSPQASFAECVRLFNAGDVKGAAKHADAVLAQDPGNVDALGLRGLAALRQSDHRAAVDAFANAASLRPSAAALHFHLGLAFAGLSGRESEAIAAFSEAVALDPVHAEARHQLGNMLKRLGRFEDAAVSLAEAARLSPGNATVWLNLGVAQLEQGRARESVESFRRAVQLAPKMAEAHNILGAALLDSGEVTQAEHAFCAALSLRPNYPAAHNNRARALKAQARMQEAIAEYRLAVAASRDPGMHSNLVYALNFSADASPEEMWNEHVSWARQHAAGLERHPTQVPVDAAGRRLRVGFVSPDLVNHAVAYFFEPLLAAYDRTDLEVFCYSDAPVPDRVTQRLRGRSEHWRETAGLSDEQLDAVIRRDAIDVLVDLAGHTARNRLLVFARKPAPVQVTWLGYPNTTGLPTIDYRITDGVADPMGSTEPWHSEKLFRMPGAFLCYQPPAEAPHVGGCPSSRTGCVTFASFSNLAKLSPPCIALWAEILRTVPGSRLLLKSRGLADPCVDARLRGLFLQHGVSADRLTLDGTLVSTAEHLAQYHGVDVALDPFPYNGTTSTCEALWMGVPVVTLEGRTHVSRVGASLLTRLGRGEWISRTPAEYVGVAVDLASDPQRRGQIRQSLRCEMAASALCDAPGFTREFAAALRGMWRQFRDASC